MGLKGYFEPFCIQLLLVQMYGAMILKVNCCGTIFSNSNCWIAYKPWHSLPMKGNFQIPRQRVRDGGERGGRQTDRQTDRQRQRQADRDRETEAKREGRERERERETARERGEKDREGQRHRQRQRQTDRQTDLLSQCFPAVFGGHSHVLVKAEVPGTQVPPFSHHQKMQ